MRLVERVALEEKMSNLVNCPAGKGPVGMCRFEITNIRKV